MMLCGVSVVFNSLGAIARGFAALPRRALRQRG
jgi:hypothetical protein